MKRLILMCVAVTAITENLVVPPQSAHAIPITPISVEASSTFSSYDKDNLINNSGLAGGLHSNQFTDMWMNNQTGAQGVLTFDLGGSYDITSTDIWQYNATCCGLNRGVRGFDIFASNDGVTFALIQSSSLSVSSGGSIAAQNIALSSTASHIRFEITSNHGDARFTGLSEVKFNGDVSTPGPAVPEPSTMLLLASGLFGLVGYRWHQRRREGVQIE